MKMACVRYPWSRVFRTSFGREFPEYVVSIPKDRFSRRQPETPASHDQRRAPLKLAVVVVSQLLGDLIGVKEGIGKPFVEVTAISTFPRAIRSDNEHKLGSFGHGQPGCGKGAY